MDEYRKMVAEGYDALGGRFDEWSARFVDPAVRFIDVFARMLGRGAVVADLGCGPGVPARRLDRCRIVGVDLSREQLRIARTRLPAATLVQADLASVAFRAASLDGVMALYSILHVPRDAHAELFARVWTWLRPGGAFLATLGAGGTEAWVGEWLGVPMHFSGHDADTNRRLIASAGFVLLEDQVVTVHEPEGDATFLVVLARRPS